MALSIGTFNCYLPSGTNGVLSLSNTSYEPAWPTTRGMGFCDRTEHCECLQPSAGLARLQSAITYQSNQVGVLLRPRSVALFYGLASHS